MWRACSATQSGTAEPGGGGVAALTADDELLAAPPSNRFRSGFLQLMPKVASSVSHSQDLDLIHSGDTREPSISSCDLGVVVIPRVGRAIEGVG